LSFTATGTPLWAKQFGSAASNDVATEVAVDASNNVVIAGYFTDTISFGGAELT
jgi:hypothetical protein